MRRISESNVCVPSFVFIYADDVEGVDIIHEIITKLVGLPASSLCLSKQLSNIIESSVNRSE